MPNNELPNKCDSCALRYPCPPEFDASLKDIELLFKKSIIKKIFPKSITIDAKTGTVTGDFCLLSRPEWPNKEKPCASWQLDFKPSKSDAVNIALATEMIDLAKTTKNVAIIAVCLGLLSIILSIKEPIQKLLSGQ
jgi:hypothetical protein